MKLHKRKKRKIRIKSRLALWGAKKRNAIVRFYTRLGMHMADTNITSLNGISGTFIDLNIGHKCRITFMKKILLNNVLNNRLFLNEDSANSCRLDYFRSLKLQRQFARFRKKRGWFLKKQRREVLRVNLKIRLKQNVNVEVNTVIKAFTIISKEFMNSPKFVRSKPTAFTSRINRFIGHFFI